MKSNSKTSFGLGLLVGCLAMLIMGLNMPQNQQEDEYHLFYHGAYNITFVYNSTTGEFKQLDWKVVKNTEAGNLKEFFEKE